MVTSTSCRDTTGKVASIFISYADSTDLEKAPPDTDFVFILARNGIRVPDWTCSNSYPNDIRYKLMWSKGLLIEEGKQLMGKVGRSLYTRYRDHVQHWSDGAIYVTSLAANYASQSAEQLIDGLLYNGQSGVKGRITVNKEVNFDKTELFVNSERCRAYDWLAYEVEKVDGPVHYARSKGFLDFLSAKVGAEDNSQEWHMSSPKQVFWLWEILYFESLSRHRQHSWVDGRIRRDILSTVREYYREVICGNSDMPRYIVGRMFQEMINGYRDKKRKMHIHVTDNLSFAAFKSVLFDSAPEPPEFGETLIVEVYSDQQFGVHSFKPIESRFQKELPFKDLNINEQFSVAISHWSMRLGLPMKETVWSIRCNDITYIQQLVLRVNQKNPGTPITIDINPKTHEGESRCVNYPIVDKTQEHSSIFSSVAGKIGFGKGHRDGSKQPSDNQAGDQETVDDNTQTDGPSATENHHTQSSRFEDESDEKGNEGLADQEPPAHRESAVKENQHGRSEIATGNGQDKHIESPVESHPSPAPRAYPQRRDEDSSDGSSTVSTARSPHKSDFTIPNPDPLPSSQVSSTPPQVLSTPPQELSTSPQITSASDDAYNWNTPTNYQPESSWNYNVNPQTDRPFSQGVFSAASAGVGITESPSTSDGNTEFPSSRIPTIRDADPTMYRPITETPKYYSPPSWESDDYGITPPSGYVTHYELPSRDTAISDPSYYRGGGLESSNPTFDSSRRSVYDSKYGTDQYSPWDSGVGAGLDQESISYPIQPGAPTVTTITTYPSTADTT